MHNVLEPLQNGRSRSINIFGDDSNPERGRERERLPTEVAEVLLWYLHKTR